MTGFGNWPRGGGEADFWSRQGQSHCKIQLPMGLRSALNTRAWQIMSQDKDEDRSRRKKRRGQLDREKGVRRAEQSRTAHQESKSNDEKAKLDLRIQKLIEQGFSLESVAKRIGVTMRRVNSALD
jgi:hypothetical protein